MLVLQQHACSLTAELSGCSFSQLHPMLAATVPSSNSCKLGQLGAIISWRQQHTLTRSR